MSLPSLCHHYMLTVDYLSFLWDHCFCKLQ